MYKIELNQKHQIGSNRELTKSNNQQIKSF